MSHPGMLHAHLLGCSMTTGSSWGLWGGQRRGQSPGGAHGSVPCRFLVPGSPRHAAGHVWHSTTATTPAPVPAQAAPRQTPRQRCGTWGGAGGTAGACQGLGGGHSQPGMGQWRGGGDPRSPGWVGIFQSLSSGVNSPWEGLCPPLLCQPGDARGREWAGDVPREGSRALPAIPRAVPSPSRAMLSCVPPRAVQVSCDGFRVDDEGTK